MAVLVTGGARSGKSGFAEQYTRRAGARGIYIATSEALDSEMEARIRKHKEDRDRSGDGFAWTTIEEPYDAAGVLERLHAEQAGGGDAAVLLDCLTLWLTNWLLRTEEEGEEGEQKLAIEIDRLVAAIKNCPCPLIIVTNEVGDGIVPSYSLGRKFRDEAGRLNARVAEVCDRVFRVTAGIPVELKSIAFRWKDL